ncbi:MAG: hypothetical protein HXM85_08505 [Neisseria sp.]|nr:hypothetical protein [Neisseria sp.]
MCIRSETTTAKEGRLKPTKSRITPSDFVPSRNFQTTVPYFPKSCSLRTMSGV